MINPLHEALHNEMEKRSISAREFLEIIVFDSTVCGLVDSMEEGWEALDYVERLADMELDLELTEDRVCRIEKLATEAAAHGDLEMVAICNKALDGDEGSISECLSVLDEAAANN